MIQSLSSPSGSFPVPSPSGSFPGVPSPCSSDTRLILSPVERRGGLKQDKETQ